MACAEPEETGKTFAENARIKAMAAAKAAGRAAFADDCGLVVDALGGEPGIHSARWAGPDKDFRAAMNRIQTLLIERGAQRAGTAARAFHRRAVSCLARRPHGRIRGPRRRRRGWPPRGEQGFGYDPLFQPDGFDRTFGQMSAQEKHGLPPKGQGLSHRARAFVKLAQACLRGD